MESTNSSTCSQHLNLPPGFRFHPTDEELLVHYLKKQASSTPLPVTIIAEIDLYKFDPWELPSKATFGEQEWYFFSPRDRKYPNGARPNRAATSGYWKATGTDKPILSSNGAQKLGVKKALVFYGGKPPKGIKTNWIMHEYRLVDNNSSSKHPGVNLETKKTQLRLDDWVLCRIYKKNNSSRPMERENDDCMENMIASKCANSNSGGLIENDQENYFEGMQSSYISQLGSSISSKSSMSMTSNIGKRPFPLSHQYGNLDISPAGKRFHCDDHSNGIMDGIGNGSFVSMLNQLSQSASQQLIHPNTVLGSLGDCSLHQPYQLSSMNWPNS